MLTHPSACAEGTGPASRPELNLCFPSMRVAEWALVTLPPHLPAAVRSDEDLSKMSILGMIPLVLQHWAEQADVRTLTLICVCVLIRAMWLAGAEAPIQTIDLIQVMLLLCSATWASACSASCAGSSSAVLCMLCKTQLPKASHQGCSVSGAAPVHKQQH